MSFYFQILSCNMYLTEQTACCYMFVEGNPAPSFKFFKGTTEITEGGRYKLISDGDNNNMIMMAVTKVKDTDEAEYRVYIENCHGSDEANFMLFVSGHYTSKGTATKNNATAITNSNHLYFFPFLFLIYHLSLLLSSASIFYLTFLFIITDFFLFRLFIFWHWLKYVWAHLETKFVSDSNSI